MASGSDHVAFLRGLMRPGHWLILAAIVGACITLERASSKIEHAIIVSGYYQSRSGGRLLPLQVALPDRYVRRSGAFIENK